MMIDMAQPIAFGDERCETCGAVLATRGDRVLGVCFACWERDAWPEYAASLGYEVGDAAV